MMDAQTGTISNLEYLFSSDPAVRRTGITADLTEMFAKLGDAGPGMGFCISTQGIQDIGGVDAVLALPKPDYEHGIFRDNVTDNLMVERPGADGVYYYANMPRLR